MKLINWLETTVLDPATFDKRCNRINNLTINFDSAIDRNGLGIHYEGAKQTFETSSSRHQLWWTFYRLFNLTVNFQNERASINSSSYLPRFNDPKIAKITRQVPPPIELKFFNLIFDNVNDFIEIYLWGNNLDYCYFLH